MGRRQEAGGTKSGGSAYPWHLEASGYPREVVILAPSLPRSPRSPVIGRPLTGCRMSDGTRLPKPAAAFCCGTIRNSPALGTLGENVELVQYLHLQKQHQPQQHQHQRSTRIASQPTYTGRVAEAQPATACPTIILLPSCLFLNCFLRLHIFPFRQLPFRRVAVASCRHFEISKCPAPVTNPMLFKFDVPAHFRCHRPRQACARALTHGKFNTFSSYFKSTSGTLER